MRWRLWINNIREWLAPVVKAPQWVMKNVRKPEDREEGWVIALTTCENGTPYKYFRYCPQEVWRWTTKRSMAEVFPTRKTAENAAMNSSVYYKSAYRIVKI